jgi:hypothetical protein
VSVTGNLSLETVFFLATPSFDHGISTATSEGTVAIKVVKASKDRYIEVIFIFKWGSKSNEVKGNGFKSKK